MDKENRALEDFVQKAIKNNKEDKPSLDFTANIMSQIEVSQQSEITKYKSPISKTAWAAIFTVIGLLCTYLLFTTSGEESSWFTSLDYSFLSENILVSVLSSINIPSSVVYGIVALAIMTILQVPIYKNYYNKRLGL